MGAEKIAGNFYTNNFTLGGGKGEEIRSEKHLKTFAPDIFVKFSPSLLAAARFIPMFAQSKLVCLLVDFNHVRPPLSSTPSGLRLKSDDV